MEREESNKEKSRESFDRIWESIGPGSFKYLDESFKKIAPKLLEFLISRLLLDDELEIGCFGDGREIGSIISYNVYDKEKELTLRLNSKNNFELRLELWDFDEENLIYKFKVLKKHTAVIPDGLKNLMKEVMLSSKTITVKSKMLRS